MKEGSYKQPADTVLRTFLVLSHSQNPLPEKKCCFQAVDSALLKGKKSPTLALFA